MKCVLVLIALVTVSCVDNKEQVLVLQLDATTCGQCAGSDVLMETISVEFSIRSVASDKTIYRDCSVYLGTENLTDITEGLAFEIAEAGHIFDKNAFVDISLRMREGAFLDCEWTDTDDLLATYEGEIGVGATLQLPLACLGAIRCP